jgi:hypothetical protein
MTKNLYIAATGKDIGKSTISFALISYLQKKGKSVGFMKPVGQRWLPSEWGEVEEDVILMKEYFNFEDNPADMNPIVIRRGYTESYLKKLVKPDLGNDILNAYRRISANKDYLIIEGTGHAGVGAVLDKSNAAVAKLLNANVVLVVKGGIGSAIDRLELNRIYFESYGVQVIGVIANKVIKEKKDKVQKSLSKYAKKHNLQFFGVIPYSPILSNPNLGQIIDELKPNIITETGERDVVVDRFFVGASTLEEFIDFIKEKEGNLLAVFPSARLDLGLAIPSLSKIIDMGKKRLFCILLTGSKPPPDVLVAALKSLNINVLWKEGDTFSVTSKLTSISIKTRPKDNFKLREIEKIVANNIRCHNILNSISLTGVTISKLKSFKTKLMRFFGK